MTHHRTSEEDWKRWGIRAQLHTPWGLEKMDRDKYCVCNWTCCPENIHAQSVLSSHSIKCDLCHSSCTRSSYTVSNPGHRQSPLSEPDTCEFGPGPADSPWQHPHPLPPLLPSAPLSLRLVSPSGSSGLSSVSTSGFQRKPQITLLMFSVPRVHLWGEEWPEIEATCDTLHSPSCLCHSAAPARLIQGCCYRAALIWVLTTWINPPPGRRALRHGPWNPGTRTWDKGHSPSVWRRLRREWGPLGLILGHVCTNMQTHTHSHSQLSHLWLYIVLGSAVLGFLQPSKVRLLCAHQLSLVSQSPEGTIPSNREHKEL